METASYHGSKNVLSKAARLSLTLVFLFPIEELLDGDQHHPLLRLVYTQQLLCCVVVVIVGNLGPSCLLRRRLRSNYYEEGQRQTTGDDDALMLIFLARIFTTGENQFPFKFKSSV